VVQQGMSQPSVLLLSGRPAFLDPLSQAFSAAGLTVHVARDQDAAVSAFVGRDGIPSGVIVDLLTIDDGAANVCAVLREAPAAASVPVLFIGTGAESIRSTTDALIAGGDGFFQVPVEAGRVVAKIAAYVGTPSPILPHGLLVTIDEHDLLERTPEPVRTIVVAPAMLPGDLLGDDDELLQPAILHSGRNAHSFVDDQETPPSGIGRPPEVRAALDDDAFNERTFADRTIPVQRMVPRGVPADVATADGDVINDTPVPRRDVAAIEAATVAAAASAEGIEFDRLVAETAARQFDDDHRRRLAEAEATLAAVRQRRANAVAEVEMLRDEQRLRKEAEEAELLALDEARTAAEADLRTAMEFQAARLQEEEARLKELVEARHVAEQALEQLTLEQAARLEQEEVRVAALAAERVAAEAALAALHDEQQRRLAAEQARLAELSARREQLLREHDDVVSASQQRVQEDQSELDAIAERQQQVQRDLDAADAARVQRLADEAAALNDVTARRVVVEGEEAAAAAQREARRRDEEAHLQALQAEREALQFELSAALDAAAARAHAEEARLAQLHAERLAAEQAVEQLHAEHTARLADEQQRVEQLQRDQAAAHDALAAAQHTQAHELAREEARLAALRDEVKAREHNLAQLDETERQQRVAEQQRLHALATERASLEAAIAALTSTSADEEQRTRSRLAELEIERLRAQEAVDQLSNELHRRREEAQNALTALDSQRAEAEVTASTQRAALAAAIAAEQEQLTALQQQRIQREQVLSDEHAAQQAQLHEQEAVLQRLSAQAAAERLRLAEEAAVVEQALRQQTASARSRLEELQAEQQALVQAAAREAERLTQLRAEEEAARAALDDARARARLAFVGGRFDAMPPGTAPLATDVGRQRRSSTDDEGLVHGGHVVDIAAAWAHEPAPPLPFRTLEPPEGRLVDGELPALLLAAHRQRVTGAVTITTDGHRQRVLFLEEGEPVFVSSSSPQDRPEEALLKAGLVTAAVYSTLRAGEPVSARRLCARLVDDGALKLEELFSAVRGVLTEHVLHLFEGAAGAFTFSEERAHAADRVRLEHHFDAVIAEGVRRKYDDARLWSVLGGPSTLLGAADLSVTLPPLSPQERLVVEQLDGTRTLDDVVLGAGLHAHVVLRTALLAVACGAVNVLARGLPVGATDVVARREQSLAIDRARVVDRLALARHGDYFTFLGVEPDATPFEVHRAAARLRERFEPARYGDGVYADLRPALREIVDVVNDAEAVLADQGLREAYRANLRAPASAPRKSMSAS
jgi:hypothetical protein